MTREEMINELREKTCRVIFKKVNGEERDMQCTLQESILPTRELSTKPKKANDSVLAVFDINKKEFRSFRVENVISFACA